MKVNKRFQVFISSTYCDLEDERREVIQALLELDCIPSGMELFPAADDDQWTLIKRVIDDCDYYVVIVGGRYGSVSASGTSYTEMEYDYAVAQSKPVMAFLHQAPEDISAKKTESSEEGRRRLEVFRNKLKGRMVKFWGSPLELGSVVSRSLVQQIKVRPTVGWVRGDAVPSADLTTELARLRTENEELRIRIKQSETQPPEGIEDLEQGRDRFEIQCTVQDKYMGDLREGVVVDFSWDEIVSCLAPNMITPISEGRMRKFLGRMIKERSARGSYEVFVSESSFQTIKIQLRALGLISHSVGSTKEEVKKDVVIDVPVTYWVLTPYGDHLMAKLMAVRSERR